MMTLCGKRLAVMAGIALLGLWSQPAAGDGLSFSVSAQCQEGEAVTTLSARCSVDLHCLERYSTIYGCNEGCVEERLLAQNVTWNEVECRCFCMISGNQYACDATPLCDEGAGDYAKCLVTGEAVLPYSCEELGYDSLCSYPQCPKEDPQEDWFCENVDCYAPCVSFYSGDEGAVSCPRSGSGLGSVDCSTAAISLDGACSIVMGFFGLVLVLSLVTARRRNRPPR